MLGNTAVRLFSQSPGFLTFGSVRSSTIPIGLANNYHGSIIFNVTGENLNSLLEVFENTIPDVVINCMGVIKTNSGNNSSLAAIEVNALLPHRLAKLCGVAGARLINISTDGIFSGTKGMYTEMDIPDTRDLYALSKYLGEVNAPHVLTLRTSIIGHELNGGSSLVDWFMKQQGVVKGFTRIIFSGLPALELARVIRDYIILNTELHGAYHISADPISKFDLLTLVAEIYKKKIDIIPDSSLVIDRSLNSIRFRSVTGYQPKPWIDLIREMYHFG